jgi:hypothetical protein
MRKRWISGGQDFIGVCARFVVVAFACGASLAKDPIAATNGVASETKAGALRVQNDSTEAAAPTGIDRSLEAQTKIEAAANIKEAQRRNHFSHFPGYLHPPAPPAKAPLGHIISREKKAVRGLDERPAKLKGQLVARDEIKKSADDVRQEARLIALNGQGITFEQRRMMKDAAAEWRRQLRLQLIGNVTREVQTDNGLEEAKRVAKEQARKITEEAKSQTRRE